MLAYYLSVSGKLPSRIGVFDFLLLVLATFRIIRLVTYDKITEFVRDYFASYDNSFAKTIKFLVNCVWCVGIWAALFCVAMYYFTPFGWIFLLLLAVSGLASFLQVVAKTLTNVIEKLAVQREVLERDLEEMEKRSP